MSIELTTAAEREALKAQDRPEFGGLNLLHIKRQVAQLAAMIGREGLFSEYTKHDISHIDAMLESLEWLVPGETKEVMSPAEWLMIVLAIYFHDLGMLVTKTEFDGREKSGFAKFVSDVLYEGATGLDFQARVNQLPEERRELFLYQEFVRHNHPQRIRAWVTGPEGDHLGVANDTASEVNALLSHLGSLFRRDLGIVCESHHLDDLGDTIKYKVSQPYGNSEEATANLQYCAVLLRTADLLHMTSDRTPSVEFRVINPSDPISQDEWARQMAVTRVRAKVGIDEDGQLDQNAPKDTIEVHAFFSKEDGFFGLTSYLGYVGDQLKKSHEWVSSTLKARAAPHEFPWRRIDDSNVETEGFLKHAFEFSIDQAKILDLLTGHTLYNDTNVVIRELVQNSIDAIRLQYLTSSPKDSGIIEIEWDDATRVLSVMDNGTGMTQSIVDNFLLKVGSSRYQDPEFVKKHPGFNSISRFGIGVLSTFMIADSVEILTSHEEDDKARRLTLRSVHGKYLVRLLDKMDPAVKKICRHGTILRLHIRPSVEMGDVVKTASLWIVVPDCSITVRVNGDAAQSIGFSSPAEALRGYLQLTDLDFYEAPAESPEGKRKWIRIVEKSDGGVTLAYALVWDRWFKEWSFLTLDSVSPPNPNRENPRLGTCIEGIRIVTDTPGFLGYPFVALTNVRGPLAPKTNVARSGLEMTAELLDMLKTIYRLYAQHIVSELTELAEQRSFSPTWAAGETEYLLAPLTQAHQRYGARALDSKLLKEAIGTIPFIMVELQGKRIAYSIEQLAATRQFWTIDCGLLRSAEALVREVSAGASLSQILNALHQKSFVFPSAPVVCRVSDRSDIVEPVFDKKEVDHIRVDPEQRRVDLRWVDRSVPGRWARIPERYESNTRHALAASAESLPVARIAGAGITVDAEPGLMAVNVFGVLYLLPGSEIARFAYDVISVLEQNFTTRGLLGSAVILGLISNYVNSGAAPTDASELAKKARQFDAVGRYYNVGLQPEECFDFSEFTKIMINTKWKSFDTSAWGRDRHPYWFD